MKTHRFVKQSASREEVGYINLSVGVELEGEDWIGYCEELGTSAFADTEEQAWEELLEAVALQLNEMERLGFIEEYLRERGLRFVLIPSSAVAEPWTAARAG